MDGEFLVVRVLVAEKGGTNLTDYNLTTVFTSTYPIDCYILKGRLETDGITCFIYDEYMISVNPFNSVAVGGVKLKVSIDQVEKAILIIDKVENNILIDESGEYEKEEIFNNEIERQNIILNLKKSILEKPEVLNDEQELKKHLDSRLFSEIEIELIITKVKEFHQKSQKKFEFNWKQFWYELLDFERDFFKYIHPNNDKFYIEKGIVDNYSNTISEHEITNGIICPKCNSENVKFGHAIDNKPDILYLILSLLARAPFFPFRKKHHCFDCGHSFKS